MLEDTAYAFTQMSQNWHIPLEVVGIILSIAFFNGFGVATTKNASAPQRSTIDTSRTLLIWIFFLAYPGPAQETFHWMQLAGFILLVAGTLIYNEIVVVPLLGFDENTKEAIKKREESEGLLPGAKRSLAAKGGDNDYVGLSPHAGYDQNRNKRALNRKMEEEIAGAESDDFKVNKSQHETDTKDF